VSVDIRAIDVHDEAQLHAWWATGKAAACDRAYDVYPVWEHSRVALVEESPEHDLTQVAAYDDGTVVGIALVELPLLENTHVAFVDVGVPPSHRGRGAGAALLARVEQLARDAGRTHLIAAAFTPPGGTSPGAGFAAAHGYEVANTEGFKVLDLHEHPDWAPLDEQVAARVGGYRIVQWDTFTPEEHLDGLASALSGFMSMVPTGELALEDGEWTAERLRDGDQRLSGRMRRIAAAAIAPGGELVGYTDVKVSRAQTTHGSVGVTFVLPEHRGHALGLAMKLANHRTLIVAHPECGFVQTSNADVNDHMDAVNEAMGYRQVEDILEVQKVISS
jgi:GNAT superfamily N-acetyltransferase